QCLEAAFDRSWSQCSPGVHRPYDAFEVLGPKVFKLKQIAEQLSRALGYDESVRLGDTLQPCSEIGCLADDPAFLRLALRPLNRLVGRWTARSPIDCQSATKELPAPPPPASRHRNKHERLLMTVLISRKN